MEVIKILDYGSEHQPYFEKFNRQWIEKYFFMEPVDEFVLTEPEEALLKPGGAILMASYNGEIAGTVALHLNLQRWLLMKSSDAKELQRL